MTAADAFRAWRPTDPPSTFDAFRAGFLACAAEAERLCRARVLDPGEHECLACENCADAIAKLAEVDRG